MGLHFTKKLSVLAGVMLLTACAQDGVTLIPSDYSMDANARERYLVYFAHDSYELDDVATMQVEALFEEVAREGFTSLSVNGHTDTTGSDRYNMMLSNHRADSVKNKLIKMGMDKKKIQTFGFGETDLAVPTPDDTYEPQNRRVEAVIY